MDAHLFVIPAIETAFNYKCLGFKFCGDLSHFEERFMIKPDKISLYRRTVNLDFNRSVKTGALS
jgi:hypothetical protein